MITNYKKKHELILHVGSPKTGSSTLQSVLIDNHNELIKKGIYFFRDDYGTLSSVWGYHNWKWLIDDEDDSMLSLYYPIRKTIAIESNKDFCERIRREFLNTDCTKLIISEEALFDRVHHKVLAVIRDVFYDFQIKVICYLRRQDLYIESLFDQHTKWMELFDYSLIRMKFYAYNPKCNLNFTVLLPEFNNYISNTVESIDYLQITKKMEEIFGKDSLCIRVYEKNALINDDIVDDFFTNALNLPYGFGASINARVYLNNIRLGKSLAIMKLKGNIYNQDLYNDIAISLGSKHKNINYFTDSARNEFLGFFKESNEILAHEYLDREDGILFHEPVPSYDHLDKNSESFESDVLAILMNSTHLNSVSGKSYRFNHFSLVIEQILDYAIINEKSVLLYGIMSRTAEFITNLAQIYNDTMKLTLSDKKLLSNTILINGKKFNSCQLTEIIDLAPDYIIITISDYQMGFDAYSEIISLELKNTTIFPCYDFSDVSWKKFTVIEEMDSSF